MFTILVTSLRDWPNFRLLIIFGHFKNAVHKTVLFEGFLEVLEIFIMISVYLIGKKRECFYGKTVFICHPGMHFVEFQAFSHF